MLLKKKRTKFFTDNIEISSDGSDEKKKLTKKFKYKKVTGFASSLLKYQKETKLGAQKFNFPKDKKAPFLFSGVERFYFSSIG